MLFYLSMIPNEQDRVDFEQVYKENYLAFIRFAAQHTNHDQLLAEDAVHNAVVKILKNYAPYMQESHRKLKAALMTTIWREAHNIMKHEMLRRHEPIHEYEEVAENMDVPLQELFTGNETFESIVRCIEMLDDLYKTVFTLRYLHDFRNKEIANMLNISETSVSVRLFRAKRQLQEFLNKEGIQHG